MLDDIDTERESAASRVKENGVGTELLRSVEVNDDRERMADFYTHASLADLVALRRALILSESIIEPSCCATLVEAFLRLLAAGMTC